MQTLASSNSERAFIGAILNGDTHATEHGLRLSDFSDDLCRAAFSACLQLEAQGKQADLVTLFDTFPDIDSSMLITLTQEAAIGGSLADQHAANIRSAGQRRKLSELFLRAAQATQDTSQPLEDTVSKVRAYLDLTAAQTNSDDLTMGTDALVAFALWLEAPSTDKGISTGLSRLDMKLNGGFKGGKLYVIGARTGVGKSALMSFMATHAIKNGKRVLYVSLEMDDVENISRMVASISGTSLGLINNREMLSDGDIVAITDAYALLPGDNFRFSTRARTPEAVRRAALKMRAQPGLDMIVVDYLQIMQPDGRTSSRVEALGQITGALKLLAMELNVPVLTAAQINRASVNNGGAPRLSDLRESGSIEQDADVVILLHRPGGQEQESKKRLELAVAKNRQGSTGVSSLIFDGALMRFTQVDERYMEVS